MVMDVKRTVLLVKEEVTYDLDPTPTGAANSLIALDVDFKENAGVVEREAQWKSLDTLPSLLGEQFAEITFKIPVVGSGSAGTAPRVGALIKACAHGETVSGGVSVTYAPSSSAHTSVTIYCYMDGRLHIMTGCRGTFKMTFTATKALVMEFTFMGRYVAPTVASLPATVTYETTYKVPPVCKSSQFAYNSKTTLVVGSLEMDIANNVVKRVSLNDANGIAGFEIVDRSPKITFDPEAQFQTSFAFRTDWLTTTRVLQIIATRAAGNICTLNVPTFNITNIEYADRDSIRVEKIDGECAANAGDDSYNIVFT